MGTYAGFLLGDQYRLPKASLRPLPYSREIGGKQELGSRARPEELRAGTPIRLIWVYRPESDCLIIRGKTGNYCTTFTRIGSFFR
jgi:hypothetical protein